MKTIWQDNDNKKWVFIVIVPLIAILLVYKAAKSFNTKDYLNFIYTSMICILLFYALIIIVKTRLIIVEFDGIRVGNSPHYRRFSLEKQQKFVKWDKIREIRLEKKASSRIFFFIMRDYLIVVTKDGKEYESYISKPEEFKYILEKLNKSRLIND